MTPFALARAATLEAATALTSRPGAEFVAGGTDMVQLVRERVRAPAALVDISRLPLAAVEVDEDGARIGALARMSAVAGHPRIGERFPAIAQALLASASPQVRNAATVGGNLLQRTRCGYFRDAGAPCNKRDPGSGCPALDGRNRQLAILGGSEHCIATYAGDLAVALAALDASLHLRGPAGSRVIALLDLHRLPGAAPQVETVLEPGEMIVRIDVPASAAARCSCYVTARDRATFAWSIASAAAALDIEAGTIRAARVAVGGVATKPWRLPAVEALLVGHEAGGDLFRRAAERAGEGAVARGGNAYKVPLLRGVVARALAGAAGTEPCGGRGLS